MKVTRMISRTLACENKRQAISGEDLKRMFLNPNQTE